MEYINLSSFSVRELSGFSLIDSSRNIDCSRYNVHSIPRFNLGTLNVKDVGVSVKFSKPFLNINAV